MAVRKGVMTFNDNFKLSMIALAANGSHPAATKNVLWAAKFVLLFTITGFCFVLLVNSILFHDLVEGKYTEACKNMTMVAVAALVTFKYIILLIYQNNLNAMMNNIDEDYKLAKDFVPKEKEIVERYTKRGQWITKLWLTIATVTSALFPLKAIILMVYYYCFGEFRLVAMFDIYYPLGLNEIKDIWLVFIALNALCLAFAIFSASVYLGFDPLAPIFMLHVCGQLDLNKVRILGLYSGDYDVKVVKKRLKAIIIHLQMIYSFVERNRKTFTILFEVAMKTTIIVIPITAFEIVESLKDGSLNVEFVSFIIGCFIHCYVPCYYSDLLMEKGNMIREAVYACGWEKQMNKSICKTFVIMMAQAGRPLAMKSVFSTMNLNSFSEMCKQSYTIFNLMNAAIK